MCRYMASSREGIDQAGLDNSWSTVLLDKTDGVAEFYCVFWF